MPVKITAELGGPLVGADAIVVLSDVAVPAEYLQPLIGPSCFAEGLIEGGTRGVVAVAHELLSMFSTPAVDVAESEEFDGGFPTADADPSVSGHRFGSDDFALFASVLGRFVQAWSAVQAIFGGGVLATHSAETCFFSFGGPGPLVFGSCFGHCVFLTPGGS